MSMQQHNHKSPPSKKQRIAKFFSVQEEAEFWDTHDFTEFWNDFGPVELQFADDLKSIFVGKEVTTEANRPLQSMTVRLPVSTIAKLKRRASRKGIGVTTLARIIIVEGLNEEDETLRSIAS